MGLLLDSIVNTKEILLSFITKLLFPVFIDVENSEKIQFSILTRSASDRAFSIKVTQLRDNLAPDGCLQYHRNPEGILKTFNYEDNSQITLMRKPSYFV